MSDRKLAKQVKEDGFILIPGLIKLIRLRLLRKIIIRHFSSKWVVANSGLTQSNAAIEVGEISSIFYHSKIIEALRSLLGQEDIIFTSHFDVHSKTFSNWHKNDGMIVMEGLFRPTCLRLFRQSSL